jgi:hypothetical protein
MEEQCTPRSAGIVEMTLGASELTINLEAIDHVYKSPKI